MKVATGLAQGSEPSPALVVQAVRFALDKAGLKIANSVLLFLSADFARNLQPALRAASAAASTTLVSGCSALGIFTEDEWVLDGSVAAALVLGDGSSIVGARSELDRWLLTLAAPNALNSSWLASSGARFGGVAGDATGHGLFSVWVDGKIAQAGYADLTLDGTHGVVKVAHGTKLLGMAQRIEETSGYELLGLSGQSGLQHLLNTLEINHIDACNGIPYHRLLALFAESELAFSQGEYQTTAILGVDANLGSVTLASQVPSGSWFAWGVLDQGAAQQQLAAAIDVASIELQEVPAFALMFSCLARGPHLYNGLDQDIALLTQHYPGIPVIGFYGNGEIAPCNGRNVLCQHSVVLGLFVSES